MFVTSKDSTKIGYETYGSGLGVVLVQGGMGTAWNFHELAQALSSSFSVYLPDRRGRGLSPHEYGEDYTIQRDIEDLDALLTKTKAHFIYGLSSGGTIVLKGALTLPSVKKIAVYEPAFFVDGLPNKALARFDKQMAQGKIAAAMVTAMKAAQMGPPVLKYLPGWFLTRLTQLLLNQEAKKGSGDYPSMKELALALQYDFKIVRSMNDKMQDFKGVNKKVLLLGGSKSPAFLKASLSELEKILPNPQRLELVGLDHASSWNYDKRRNPNGHPLSCG